MKYYVAKFTIKCSDDKMQAARELLADAACESGFEAFEDTERGVDGYVQRELFDRGALDESLSCFPLGDTLIEYAVEEVDDRDWNQEWEEAGFDPIEVDGRLVVYDSRHTDRSLLACDDGVLRVFIEARNAFGTGTHETTRMVLRRLLGMDMRGKRLLDCGCGTGILGIAASLMGAGSVVGYDIDEWSADNAMHNAADNGVDNMKVLLGDSKVVAMMRGEFDVVLANINRNILLADMGVFAGCLADGGTLVLSGFYHSDVDVLRDCAAANGLRLADEVCDGEWSCLLLRKS